METIFFVKNGKACFKRMPTREFEKVVAHTDGCVIGYVGDEEAEKLTALVNKNV